MNKIVILIIRLIIPLVILFLAFTWLGTTGGIILAVLYLLLMNLPVLFSTMGSQAYRKGDYDKAIRMLRTALKMSPGSYSLRGSYAWLLLKLGKTEEAEAQIDQAISDAEKEDEKNPLLVTKALVLWKKGELDQAISLMEKVIVNYKNTNVYGTLGFLYIEKGDLDKALSFNLEAYDYNDTGPVILDNLGYTRLLRGEYEEALEIYRQLIKLRPNFPEAFHNYARVLAHFGEMEQALYMCHTALTFRFWHTSTVTREQVENTLKELEEASGEKSAKSAKQEDPEETGGTESADI
ncbi:MAG: tetratricopeptide repeat protein [Clostridiaceae bacterium]|jgi:tetratricopeptide (TPR) repeat protein|nr:tetratricopeptide repeat protein [Clostridiaceae bacterium]